MNQTLVLVVSSLLAGCLTPPHATVGRSTPGATSGRMEGVSYEDGDDTIVAEAMGFASACFADYDDMKARWAPAEATLRTRFLQIQKLPSYYAQRDELAALVKDYYAEVKAAGLDVKGITWFSLVGGGLAYEIQSYVARLHRERGITSNVALFEPDLPPPADDIVASDAYCIRAAVEGTHRTRAKSWLHVTDMLPAARARAARDYLASCQRRIKQDMAVAPLPESHFDEMTFGTRLKQDEDFPVGSMISNGGRVESVQQTKQTVQLRLVQEGSVTSQHDCVETRKVDRVEADGRIRYRENCKLSSRDLAVTYALVLPDAPSNVKKGDWIDFDGIITKATLSKSTARTGAPRRYLFELEGKLVRQVARAKRPGDPPQQFAVVASY